MLSKYAPLQSHLKTLAAPRIPMSFKDIERVINAKLPPSARKHRPWWSNNPGNSVITKAWLNAGYRTEQVDMKRERVVFRHQPGGNIGDRSGRYGTTGKPRTQSFYGCMKGMITIAEGYDLTEPADPDWARKSEEI